MANTMRWRYGETNPIILAVEPDQVIEIGDLVYVDHRDTVRPAAALSLAYGNGSEYTALQLQEHFHRAFAGVALQQSKAGDDDPIRVATTGVFEFCCPDLEKFECGQLIGVAIQLKKQVIPPVKFTPPDQEPTDEQLALMRDVQTRVVMELLNQTVTRVTVTQLAIGRCAKRQPLGGGRVLVDIVSTLMYGGPQPAA